MQFVLDTTLVPLQLAPKHHRLTTFAPHMVPPGPQVAPAYVGSHEGDNVWKKDAGQGESPNVVGSWLRWDIGPRQLAPTHHR